MVFAISVRIIATLLVSVLDCKNRTLSKARGRSFSKISTVSKINGLSFSEQLTLFKVFALALYNLTLYKITFSGGFRLALEAHSGIVDTTRESQRFARSHRRSSWSHRDSARVDDYPGVAEVYYSDRPEVIEFRMGSQRLNLDL